VDIFEFVYFALFEKQTFFSKLKKICDKKLKMVVVSLEFQLELNVLRIPRKVVSI